MAEKNIKAILIQINEAHSSKWKIGLNHHPTPQSNFQERIDRANKFVTDNNCPYDVYIDSWDNIYENTFQAWPDKYYFVDKNKKVLIKSEYGRVGVEDGKIMVDCTEVMRKLVV